MRGVKAAMKQRFLKDRNYLKRIQDVTTSSSRRAKSSMIPIRGSSARDYGRLGMTSTKYRLEETNMVVRHNLTSSSNSSLLDLFEIEPKATLTAKELRRVGEIKRELKSLQRTLDRLLPIQGPK
jgi:hypothetical protein